MWTIYVNTRETDWRTFTVDTPVAVGQALRELCSLGYTEVTVERTME